MLPKSPDFKIMLMTFSERLYRIMRITPSSVLTVALLLAIPMAHKKTFARDSSG